MGIFRIIDITIGETIFPIRVALNEDILEPLTIIAEWVIGSKMGAATLLTPQCSLGNKRCNVDHISDLQELLQLPESARLHLPG